MHRLYQTRRRLAPSLLFALLILVAAMPDLVAARHAIAVDESDAASAPIVARGVIGGQLLGDDLPVALREENGSGQAGIALLRADAERTVVTILLGIDLAVPEA